MTRWMVLVLVLGTGYAFGGCVGAGDDNTADDDDDDDTAPACDYTSGTRTISGQAYFFTMPEFGQIEQVTDVEGAEVFLFEDPSLRATLDPADGFAFSFAGIPDGCEVTLALVHDDFFPHLTGTFLVDGEDLEGFTFQSVSNELVALTTEIYGVDPDDPTVCQMVTTVCAIADGQDTVWAVGEPGATVTLDPPVPEGQGPMYFSELVLPDLTLTETTADGGVIVIGAEPGVYHWTGHKEDLVFRQLKMRCEAGWLTNAAPPWGMQLLP